MTEDIDSSTVNCVYFLSILSFNIVHAANLFYSISLSRLLLCTSHTRSHLSTEFHTFRSSNSTLHTTLLQLSVVICLIAPTCSILSYSYWLNLPRGDHHHVSISSYLILIKHLRLLPLSQLPLQLRVLALVVASDGNDDDEHQDQQPAGHAPHNDHQHALHHVLLLGTFCRIERVKQGNWQGEADSTVCYHDKSQYGTLTALVIYLPHRSPPLPSLLPLRSSPRTGRCLRLTSLGVAQKLAFHLGGRSHLLAAVPPFCTQNKTKVTLQHADL